MTPTIYCADHQHAKVVCSAFAEGCGGKLVPATSRVKPGNGSAAAMWGILRGAGERIKECELYGIPYFYIDHGYFRRGHYDGYYRVVFCDRHLQGPPRKSNGERWNALDMVKKPRWRCPTSAPVIYLPISRHVAAFCGIDAEEFDEQQIGLLRDEFQEAEIRVKPKDDQPWNDMLLGVQLVVGFQSNALLEADFSGCPTRELGRSPAKYLERNEDGWMDREVVFSWLADNQWTLQEMRSGKCWADLMARYGDRLTEAAA